MGARRVEVPLEHSIFPLGLYSFVGGRRLEIIGVSVYGHFFNFDIPRVIININTFLYNLNQ